MRGSARSLLSAALLRQLLADADGPAVGAVSGRRGSRRWSRSIATGRLLARQCRRGREPERAGLRPDAHDARVCVKSRSAMPSSTEVLSRSVPEEDSLFEEAIYTPLADRGGSPPMSATTVTTASDRWIACRRRSASSGATRPSSSTVTGSLTASPPRAQYVTALGRLAVAPGRAGGAAAAAARPATAR